MDTADVFERLKRKLSTIESADTVGADDIFEAIDKLLSDIDAMPGNGGIDSYEIKHEDTFVKSLLKTMNAAVTSYEKNAGSLSGMSERRQKSYDTAIAKIQEANKELSPLLPKIDELQKAQTDLEAKLAHLKELKATAAGLEESIQNLKDDISKLDSVSIEELQNTETELIKKKQNKQTGIDTLTSSIESLTGDIETLSKTIIEKSAVQNHNKEEKIRLEEEDERLSQELSDYLTWKNSFIREQQKRLGQMTEAQNELTAIHNAWSTVSQRPDLPDLLKETGAFDAFNSTVSSFDDIKTWFDKMQIGLQTCIDAYAENYNTVLSVMK